MEDGVQLSDSANQEWTRRETKLGLRSAAPPALEPGPQARRLDDSWACHCQAEALYTTLKLAKPDPHHGVTLDTGAQVAVTPGPWLVGQRHARTFQPNQLRH